MTVFSFLDVHFKAKTAPFMDICNAFFSDFN